MEHPQRIGHDIRVLSNLLRRSMDNSALQQYVDNLTGTHGWVIGYLFHRQGQDVFQRDLENEFSIRRSTATCVLQLMEKNGLIIREPVPYDARLKKLVLTPKALELHAHIEQEIAATEALLCQGLTGAEIEAFHRTAERMKLNLLRRSHGAPLQRQNEKEETL